MTTKSNWPGEKEYMKKYYQKNKAILYPINQENLKKYRSKNREEFNEKSRLYQKSRTEEKFGVTYPQETTCEICDKVIMSRDICLDHDHKTGKFRGWLCRRCNRQLGWFEQLRSKIETYTKLPVEETVNR